MLVLEQRQESPSLHQTAVIVIHDPRRGNEPGSMRACTEFRLSADALAPPWSARDYVKSLFLAVVNSNHAQVSRQRNAFSHTHNSSPVLENYEINLYSYSSSVLSVFDE